MSGEAEARALLVPKPGAGRTGIYIEGVRRAVERIPQKPQCSALSGRLPVRHGHRALGGQGISAPLHERFCGRGQLFDLLGNRFGLSRKRDIPRFLKSTAFRYGFLIFFLVMFGNMLFATYLVFAGSGSLRQAVTLLWTFKLPWQFAYHGTLFAPWVAQFSFGFYSVMLTSTVLGLVTMLLFKPRSWCAYCPMGTMTQGICRLKHRGERAQTATEGSAGPSGQQE